MFNLEESIAEWRRRMVSAGVKSVEALDELESHLREDVARRVGAGETEDEAFVGAAQAVGDAEILKREFAKVGGRSPAWVRRLKRSVAEAFSPVPPLTAFAPGALLTLELARQEAPRLRHGFVGTEHVLLGLLARDEGVVPNLLKKMGVDARGVKRRVEECVSGFATGEMPEQLAFTPRVQKSLRLAASEAKVLGRASIGDEHIFLGLLLEGDGVAGRVLRNLGLNSERVREEIARER